MQRSTLCTLLTLAATLFHPARGPSQDSRWLAPSDPAADAAPAPAASSAPATNLAVTEYDLRGIFDPGLNNILAEAIKIPHGWRLAQSFTRDWDGAMPINKVYVGITSPDGRESIETLPFMRYHYEDGPNMDRLRQYTRQHGMQDPTELPPMSPVEYLKKVYLPLLARAKFNPRLTGEHNFEPTRLKPNQQLTVGYVEGELPSGIKFILTARYTLSSNQGPTGMLYSIGVLPSLVQSSTDLPACLALAVDLDRSVAFNPEWQRQDAELLNRGSEINVRAQIKQGEMIRQANEAHNQAINRNYERQRHANDQVNEAFCDYLSDSVLYENPDTGQRVKVQHGGRHAYQDGGGNVLTTNAPLDPNNVNWQELHEVEVRNY